MEDKRKLMAIKNYMLCYIVAGMIYNPYEYRSISNISRENDVFHFSVHMVDKYIEKNSFVVNKEPKYISVNITTSNGKIKNYVQNYSDNSEIHTLIQMFDLLN